MITAFFDRITDQASSELFFMLVGSAVLLALQAAYRRAKKYLRRRKIKKELALYKRRKEAINVVDLANGDPGFDKEHIFTRDMLIFGQARRLYVDAPEDIKAKLRTKEEKAGRPDGKFTEFHADTSFDGGKSFADIAEFTKIPELPELVAKHRRIVAEKFLEDKDGLIFNGDKFGVFNLRFTRLGKDESPGVEVDFFHTDYFTHRVFRSIYHELKGRGHAIASADNTNFLTYRPFFTSLGINTVLICEGDGGKTIVLSKRSDRVHSDRPRYHVTMNEGVSQTDKDPFGKIDLELCLRRGLKEELGIDEKIFGHDYFEKSVYERGIRGVFYDFFLEKTNFEIGVSSVLELDLDFEKDIAPMVARDKSLEIDAFAVLPLKEKDISGFVGTHDFVPHGVYVLERVLLRENMTLESVSRVVAPTGR